MEVLLNIPVLGDFIRATEGVPDSPEFQRQLSVTRNAACSWVSLVGDVNLNVFKGFGTEEDLVEYFQQQAYWDNITVFASKGKGVLL